MNTKKLLNMLVLVVLAATLAVAACCAPKVKPHPGGQPPTVEEIRSAQLADLKARANRFPAEVQLAINVFNSVDFAGLGANPKVVETVREDLQRLKKFADEAKVQVGGIQSLDFKSRPMLVDLGKRLVDLIASLVTSGETFNVKNPASLTIFKLAVSGLQATAIIVQQYLDNRISASGFAATRTQEMAATRPGVRNRVDVLIPTGIPLLVSVRDLSTADVMKLSFSWGCPREFSAVQTILAAYDVEGKLLQQSAENFTPKDDVREFATSDPRVYRVAIIVTRLEGRLGHWSLSSSLPPDVFLRDSSHVSWSLLVGSFDLHPQV